MKGVRSDTVVISVDSLSENEKAAVLLSTNVKLLLLAGATLMESLYDAWKVCVEISSE